jgi:FkbH-like protein
MSQLRKISIVADVVSKPLFRFDERNLGVRADVHHHDIDQHFQVLLSGDQPDVLVSHYAPRWHGSPPDVRALEKSFSDYVAALRQSSARQASVLIVNTIWAPREHLVGLEQLEVLNCVARLNGMLYDLAASDRQVTVVDLAGVIGYVGAGRALNLQNDLVMRMPYTSAAIPAIVGEYARSIRQRFLPRKKVLVVDADNTLWRGVVGEDGVDGIDVGGEYPGRVFAEFQRALLAARRSGLVLALVSKNNPQDVREVFQQRDMPLKWDDFTTTRVNWERKSENIASIADELDLGLDAFVFLDDNPFELEEVSRSLPGVTCLRFDWQKPNDALTLLYRQPELSTWAVTAEDRRKAEQYAEEAGRRTAREGVRSLEEYVRSLEIRIEVGCNRAATVARVAQLSNKTNQFNLTTRRYSEAEIRTAMNEGAVYDFRVVDRFGDMGIVGVVVFRHGEIETLLMSCRALGREIEGNMLAYVCARHASSRLTARYVPTVKNAMVSGFYDRNGFRLLEEDGGTKFYEFVAPRGDLTPVQMIEVTE